MMKVKDKVIINVTYLAHHGKVGTITRISPNIFDPTRDVYEITLPDGENQLLFEKEFLPMLRLIK